MLQSHSYHGSMMWRTLRRHPSITRTAFNFILLVCSLSLMIANGQLEDGILNGIPVDYVTTVADYGAFDHDDGDFASPNEQPVHSVPVALDSRSSLPSSGVSFSQLSSQMPEESIGSIEVTSTPQNATSNGNTPSQADTSVNPQPSVATASDSSQNDLHSKSTEVILATTGMTELRNPSFSVTVPAEVHGTNSSSFSSTTANAVTNSHTMEVTIGDAQQTSSEHSVTDSSNPVVHSFTDSQMSGSSADYSYPLSSQPTSSSVPTTISTSEVIATLPVYIFSLTTSNIEVPASLETTIQDTEMSEGETGDITSEYSSVGTITNTPNDENATDSTVTTDVTTETTTECSEDFEKLKAVMTIENVKEESIEVYVTVNNICPRDYYNYDVSWVNIATKETDSFNTTEKIFNISPLQPCSEYNITVKVLLENGSHTIATHAVARTISKVTDPPQFISAEMGKTSADLTWYIAFHDTPCAPMSCRVDCVVVDPSQRPGLVNGTGSSSDFSDGNVTVSVTDLSPFTNYSCLAYIENIEGESNASESIQVTTDEDAPPAPVITYVTETNNVVYISWTIDESIPGLLKDFVVDVTYIGSNASKFTEKDSYHNIVKGPEDRNLSLEGYGHYSSYEITVTASTNAGSNVSEPWELFTKPAESEKVQDLEIRFEETPDESSWVTTISWKVPKDTNGILESFDVYYDKYHDVVKYYQLDTYEHVLIGLTSDYNYTVSVVATVSCVTVNSNFSTIEFIAPAGVPSSSGTSVDQNLKADPQATSVVTQCLLTLNREIFGDNGGEINWYEILVVQSEKFQGAGYWGLYETQIQIPVTDSWSQATQGEDEYRATPNDWMPFTGSHTTEFLLGRTQDCNEVAEEYCNGPLKPDMKYVVRVRAFTGYCNDSYCRGGYKDSNPIYFKTGSDIAVGMIVGVIFAIIILGFLAILLIMYRRGTLTWPPKLFKGAKHMTVRPQPVLLKKFPAYCAQLLDTPNRLKNEFQLLATLSADIVAVNTALNAEQPENRRKNRYCNILPYDATRVTLDLVDGDPTSHYINASFIKGYSDDIEYIACQGPMEDTCVDFWRMVYQHDVRVIAMVTNLVEQNKLKCHQYYPNLQENLVFGDMTIRCTTETHFPIHTARTLVLVKGDRKRIVSHLHFREWPDFGVPQSTDFMLQFCQTMRHHSMAAEFGLLLVHCSAGVGRTGTLIAIDILLQHISENKKVDIFGTVFKLRKQRINMVQTEGQYTYIYRCIKEAVQDPTIVSQGTPPNNSLEPIYENVGTTLNSLPYEKLPKLRRV